ncbi:hypothetical protein [Micromonospora sp. NBRC 107566]
MRHLWSLLAGVVVAPLTWALVALGQDGSTRTVDGWLDTGRFDTADLIRPACYLGATAILLGLLATLRFSPLGPAVAGLALAAPYAALFVDPLAVRDAVPANWSVLNQDLPLLLPVRNGTLGVIGVLLLMAVFSRHRWRRWPSPALVDSTDTPLAPVPEPEPDVIGPRPAAEPEPVPALAGVGAAATGDAVQPGPGTTSREQAPPTERLADVSRLGTSFRRRPAPGPTAPASPVPAPRSQADGPLSDVVPEAATGRPSDQSPATGETSTAAQAAPGGSPWSAPPRAAGRGDAPSPA